MSLNYYLFCRNSYDKIIQNLDDTITIFEQIDICIKEEENLVKSDIVLSNQIHNKLFFIERKTDIKLLRDMCDKKMMGLCRHEFVEDTIDITPDKSQNIRYCSICEYTDPDPN